VRIRSRKPWVLARRRLFGWKVRLLTSKLRLQYDVSRRTTSEDNVQGHRAARRHLIRTRRSNRSTLRRAAMQVNYTVGGTPAGETTATRKDSSSGASFCAGSESFRALACLSTGGTVVASATSLLACPFAGHHCSVHTTMYRTKTGQAGESFGTVSLSKPRRFRLR
jgi:hypothetical protein